MPVHVPLRLAILSELETVSKKNKNKWTSGTELERLAERPKNADRRESMSEEQEHLPLRGA